MLRTCNAISVAATPTMTTVRLMTRVRVADEASGLTSGRYTFQAAIDEAERIDESTDDITAAATAPRPTAATAGGVRWRSAYGSTSAASGAARPRADQSAAPARMPTSAGGTAATMQPAAAISDRLRAVRSSRAASTRWKYTCHGIPPNTSSSALSLHAHQFTPCGAAAIRARYTSTAWPNPPTECAMNGTTSHSPAIRTINCPTSVITTAHNPPRLV